MTLYLTVTAEIGEWNAAAKQNRGRRRGGVGQKKLSPRRSV